LNYDDECVVTLSSSFPDGRAAGTSNSEYRGQTGVEVLHAGFLTAFDAIQQGPASDRNISILRRFRLISKVEADSV